jgi:CheY-like chemotaxis protein
MPRVLIFESDPVFASELRSGLEQHACAVTVVGDATEGLQVAASERPDLVLLTVELPRINGFSVCNKLKRDPGLKSVPLIIMSSDSNEDTFSQHRRLKHSRAEDYVHKPISAARVFQAGDGESAGQIGSGAAVLCARRARAEIGGDEEQRGRG